MPLLCGSAIERKNVHGCVCLGGSPDGIAARPHSEDLSVVARLCTSEEAGVVATGVAPAIALSSGRAQPRDRVVCTGALTRPVSAQRSCSCVIVVRTRRIGTQRLSASAAPATGPLRTAGTARLLRTCLAIYRRGFLTECGCATIPRRRRFRACQARSAPSVRTDVPASRSSRGR